MTIYKSGKRFILTTALALGAVALLFWLFCNSLPVNITVTAVAVYLSFFVATFFRLPDRDGEAVRDESLVAAPADGNVISIDEVQPGEYFDDKRLRVSIFMSFFNVHVNWYPVSGTVCYVKYHPGDKMGAMHAKSSLENEHSSIVVRTGKGQDIMFRQIAGLVARRIECNAVEGESCTQGSIVGMIKFGSRVDVFLPAGTEILVKKGDIVRGRITPLARLDR